MKNKSICALAWPLSFLGGVLGAVLMMPGLILSPATPLGRTLWSGGFFLAVFLGGFVGLTVALALSRRYKVRRPRAWPVALILCAALVFGVGAGGQWLFMYSKETVVLPAEVDMVLLLDASGSMDSYGYSEPRTEAACQFVDSLDEDCRLQVVSFAGWVLDSTNLLTMDDAGKDAAKAMIRSIDSVGMTDFNAPLQTAMDTLTTRAREGVNRAVVLLTDGEGELSQRVISAYLDSDIKVMTIRISTAARPTAEAQALISFAQGTGGFDARLTPQSGGGIDASDMLAAFEDAFQASTETRTNMAEDLLVCSAGNSLYQILIRVATLLLCALLFGIGYFSRILRLGILFDLLCGLAAALLLTLLGGLPYIVCALVLCVLLAGSFVAFTRSASGGEVIHV